ncbi:epoxide hydrolase N-terminal domain-containing protein [Actinoplanes sp. TRM 88003]|uniref:Epoxide hydrolase N-terminal domain-containing protein n=1 Tax=Paractinoplanes aksuensis TaxID=2939490 RepID=A0ABT1E161_9ACTN|nr:epoxide hydrolase N-terminal domain-containing protein [Actinoplanes aksuensis]MCO8276873.1 epoxide hydrolase N-terminal domain-containing protein [Actinoplanes aksuensis]
MSDDKQSRPFTLDTPEEKIAELHRRIAATRWPSRELVTDRSQGVQLATVQELARYWTNDHDWRAEQSIRPQTIGYSLLDSPIGLAAWMLDHDADSYYKMSKAFVDKQPTGGLTRDTVLDNITLYWLTGTGASAARWYWEFGRFLAAHGGQAPPPTRVPVAFTTFPDEIWAAPRSWAEVAYPDLAWFHEAERGGHFAAWEEPDLFAAELRAAFQPLR